MNPKSVRESAMLRRILCACLVFVIALALIPLAAPKAHALSAGETLYFMPSSDWKQANAWFAAYYFSDSGNNWSAMSDDDGDGIYETTVPADGYTSVIFTRMDPSKTALSWDSKWNQTQDLTPGDNNFFTINDGQWDGAGGTWSSVRAVYYDATLSKLSYNASHANGLNTIPVANGNDDGSKIFCHAWVEGATGTSVEMLRQNNDTYKNVWKALLPGNVTHVLFYSSDNINTFPSDTSASKTYDLKIPDDLSKPCFYGDSSNFALYKGERRNGYWGEAFNVRSAEYMKGGDVVDIPSQTFTKDADTIYVGTTFYDYYSDYELNGVNLDKYLDNYFGANWKKLTDEQRGDFVSYQNWYIFRHFNQALSSYYSSNSVKVPIYTGHFQPDWNDEGGNPWGYQFKDIADTLKLYGFMDGKAYGTSNQDQKYFMSVNNGNMDLTPTLGHVNSASQGIVGNALSGDNVVAAGGSAVLPYFSKSFLDGNNALNTRLGEVFENVQFPFTQEDINGDGIEYWVFDSTDTTLQMMQHNGTYYLDEVTGEARNKFQNLDSGSNPVADSYGFFPFNGGSAAGEASTYNYGFGARIDLTFNLTENGKVKDKYGEEKPIVFEFSGDDDVWVFIDGKLVLDIGGSHGKVSGIINFADKTATVSSVKSSGASNVKSGQEAVTTFALSGSNTANHTLTMFYLERGMWESNMRVTFNFFPPEDLLPDTTTMTVNKVWNMQNINDIPSQINVALQRKASNKTTWQTVKTQSISGTGTEWSYTFTDLAKFVDTAKTVSYEYRVVELDSNGNILNSGDTVNGLTVIYGNVYGNGGTGYGQMITNHQFSGHVVVIDFGLPVDITVMNSTLSNMGGTLYGIGDPTKLTPGISTTADRDLKTSGTYSCAHGNVTMNGNQIRYTPTDMKMDTVDVIGYAIKYTEGSSDKYYYSTVSVVPAANIYYEDNFLSFSNASNATGSYGVWATEKDANYSADKTQAEDRPGEDANNALGDLDADNVYGYDAAYDSFAIHSLGSARKVTVNKTTGGANVAPTAKFTFTGTGFDVVSLTDSTSGAIVVEVKKGSETVKNYIVNNYYGMVYNSSTGSWEIATNNSDFCLYQVPVIKVEDLDYGTYDVTIKAAYLSSMDMEDAGKYTIWLDAVRIYDPAKNDSASNGYYEQDGESNPHLTTVKKLLVTPSDFNADVTTVNGVVYIEGKSTGVTMEEYKNQGPNNETYLKNGNGIAFKLRYTGSSAPDVSLQIGAKLAIGDSATLKYNGSTLVTLKTATNMFYELGTLKWTKKTVSGSTVWESAAVLLSCTGGSDDILSLTDLKLTGADADAITTMPNPTTGEVTQIMAVVDREVYEFAVKMMSTSAETDPTEPEVTEPETTEPEVTEPETTEPEVTEPETTEPEVTEPETTEPETTEPEVTEPEVTEPEVTEPETTVPETEESTATPTQKPVKDPSNAQTGDFNGQNLPVFAMAAFISLLAIIIMTTYAVKSRKIEV